MSGRLTRYLAAAAAARIADEGARVSLVLLALDRTGSAAVGGALVAALLAPHVLAAPLVGLLIDRAEHPRRVLVTLLGGFSATLFSVAPLLGQAPLALVVALLLLGGCCGPAVTGGLSSRLPGLVGPDRLPRAFGLDSAFYNVAGMVGPALVGVTAATLGPAAAQTVLAAAAALGAVGVATVAIDRTTRAPRTDLLSGVRAIVQEPTLRVVTVSSAAGLVGLGALPVVTTVLTTSWGRPASSGLLLAVLAAGALIGSLLWTWRPADAARTPLVATLSLVGMGAPIAFAAAPGSIAVAAVLFALSGVCVGPFAAALFTVRTRYADEAVRTQVFTIGAGLKVTASALGAAVVGFFVELPVWALLLLVASTPVLAGAYGTARLLTRTPKVEAPEAPLVRSRPRNRWGAA